MDRNGTSNFNIDAEWESLLNNTSLHDDYSPRTDLNNVSKPEVQHHFQQGSALVEGTSESETEDESQEINEEDLKLNGIHEKLNTLLLQMDEIRQKYLKELELRRKVELTNKELLGKIADLEEDNVEYQGRDSI